MPRFLRTLSHGAVLALAWISAVAVAQSALPKKKEVPRGASTAVIAKSGKGYRVGLRPPWVVELPMPNEPSGAPQAAAGGAARRELLVDLQSNFALPKPQFYVRYRAVATDPSTLGGVSQPQVRFNPAFQNVVLHEASVLRDGRKLDRLKDARIEPMRREQRLEQLVIDGTETVLVVLNDVRVGEAVEFAYTVEGENPIYEGRITTGIQLAWDTPVDLLHHRIVAPLDRKLHVRGIATDLVPERLTEGGKQVLRLVRSQVPPVQREERTPPWFNAYPAVQVTEYGSWAEVDTWAQGLFKSTGRNGPLFEARVAAFRQLGLAGDALVAEVLRFVQDEVRYFSVSLGESSHRPKPPERTLSEMLGDCKDKVVLLNALLTELGFDVRPALVSVARNRGLVDYLPTHDVFDHVVTRLQLDGTTYFLDGTLNGQGSTLQTRGYWPYGLALVVGAGAELQAVTEPPQALNNMEFEQRWDLSKPGAAAQLTTVMRARGLAAEQWRHRFAAVGEQRIAEAIAGIHARVSPGLRTVAASHLKDDRKSNTLEFVQTFEHPDFGHYARGGLEAEFGSIELLDLLAGPPEARRRAPFMLDPIRSIESRIEVIASLSVKLRPPPPTEVNDRHFRFTSRTDIAGNTVTYTRRVERRADDVASQDLDRFRQSVLRAREQVSGRLRLLFVDIDALKLDMQRIERKVRSARNFKNDRLAEIVFRNELERLLHTEALKQVDTKSPLAGRVFAARAEASNLLGEFEGSRIDADAALAIDPKSEVAMEARAVSLVGTGRLDDAFGEFSRLSQTSRRHTALKWMGAVEVMRGRHADAERLLREVIDSGGGEDREFALLWLYVAAEYQGGRGDAVITPYLESADPKKLTGAMLRYLNGRIDRDSMLKVARESAGMERLNLAEAYFFIGQKLAAQGRRDEALQWFQRTVDTEAVPYREVTFARLELGRGR